MQHNNLNNSNEIEKLNCKGDRYLSLIDLSSNNLAKLKGDLGKIKKIEDNKIEKFTFIAENNKINNLSPDFFKNVKSDSIFIYFKNNPIGKEQIEKFKSNPKFNLFYQLWNDNYKVPLT